MVTVVLLILIYLAFISLGLPDSILGVAWPAMRMDWGMPLDAAGLIALVMIGGTIVSSFSSGYFIRKFGTGKITTVSCFMTGLALLGFSFSPSYIWLIFLAVPLGLGAGAVDAGLNNYVAQHFKAHHMNWLHSFWGVGSTLGPIIVGRTLAANLSWRNGFQTISIIQLSLAFVLLASLPIWTKHKALMDSAENKTHKPLAEAKPQTKVSLKTKGLFFSLATFLFYCAVEISIGLWGSSFLVQHRGLLVETAAYWLALYYGSIMVGRVIAGFITFKVSNAVMIRSGAIMALVGTSLLLLPLPSSIAPYPLVLIGLGLSPIFPSMIHETPKRFGKDKSQTIIGYQMGFAYIGSAVFPPLIGLIITHASMLFFPAILVFCSVGVLVCTEMAQRKTKASTL